MIESYKVIQKIANDVLNEVQHMIKPSMTEKELVDKTIAIIKAKGVDEFWYHNVPAIVAVGTQTLGSVSGKDYQPSDKTLQANDFLTVDLSLAQDNHWAIRGRSFVLEDGEVKTDNFTAQELQKLQLCNAILHDYLTQNVTVDTTFDDLYHEMKTILSELNIEHLDFKNNFGHTIEKDLDSRVYITAGVHQKLGNCLFSFEPHLKLPNGSYGFKDADVYYFKNMRPERL